jgi:hypothetical protein
VTSSPEPSALSLLAADLLQRGQNWKRHLRASSGFQWKWNLRKWPSDQSVSQRG